MNIADAINSLMGDLKTIDGLQVQTEAKERGGRGDVLTITTAEHTRPPQFGASKIKQGLRLKYETYNTDPAHISAQLVAIGDAITGDRRRGGNAQTTEYPVEEWESTEDEGREGAIFETLVRIVINAD